MLEAFKDKFTLLCHTAELLYVSTDGFRASKRIAKVMMIFSQMYNSLHSYQSRLEKERNAPLPYFMQKHDRNKFLQGSLFALNGLLNNEAKSYLQTMEMKSQKEQEKAGFVLLAPITNSENPIDEAQAKNLRNLTDDDLAYF